MIARALAGIRRRRRLQVHRYRDRPLGPAETAAYYSELEGLVDATDLPTEMDRLPATFEAVPDRPVALDAVDVTVDDGDPYELPAAVRLRLEHLLPELREYFVAAGHHSELLLRAESVDSGAMRFGTTSYYRSFVTNLCADYGVSGSRRIRDDLHRYVVRDGSPVGLSESALSNHVAVSGLVVSTSGRSVLTRRSNSVSVARGRTSLSFAGSLEYEPSATAPVKHPLVRELREELAVPRTAVEQVVYLGTVRRLEWLGKPSLLVLVLVDPSTEFRNVSNEHASIDPFSFGTGTLSDVSDLLSTDAGTRLLEAVTTRIAESSAPGVELLAHAALLERLVGPGAVS